jgi:S-adenosylmethionine:diacylglycerol 3-amino-3-carboxypropyl transferase
MHEDCAVELAIFPPGGRVFCIASAGCTALALAARGDRVVAVDVNPEQIAHARARLDGAPPREGAADRMLARGRRLLFPLWAGRRRLEAFLSLEDPEAQARSWRETLDTAVFRAATALALSPLVLRAAYSRAFVAALPRGFARVIRERLARGFACHPNARNPYAWRLLLAREPPALEAPSVAVAPRPSAGSPSFEVAEAASYLEACPGGSFAGFTLSNILDGVSSAYRERLLTAVRRASAPEGILVLRSLAEPEEAAAAEWARRDRSLLWGAVRVERVQDGGPIPCSTG